MRNFVLTGCKPLLLRRSEGFVVILLFVGSRTRIRIRRRIRVRIAVVAVVVIVVVVSGGGGRAPFVADATLGW